MIEIPTTLVLGAGASAHAGYPVGSGLLDQICKLKSTHAKNFWKGEEIGLFLRTLPTSGYSSVDAFLEHRAEFRGLGKFLIAERLKQCERQSVLFPLLRGWYQTLVQSLVPGNDADELPKNRLSIVTFNYDRSVECALHSVLRSRCRISSDEASTILAELPIIHLYGNMGSYPETPYEPSSSPEELRKISEHIQIVPEVDDSEDDFCNEAFAAANKALVASERIYFLGFGFGEDNVKRFRFFSPENLSGKTVETTTSGISAPRDAEKLIRRMEKFGLAQAVAKRGHVDCGKFFSHRAALE